MCSARLRSVWVRVAREAASYMPGHRAYAALQDLTVWPEPVAADLEIWRGLAGCFSRGKDELAKSPEGSPCKCGFPPRTAAPIRTEAAI